MSCSNRPGGGRRKSTGSAVIYLLAAVLCAQVLPTDMFYFNFFGDRSSSDNLDYNAQNEPAIRHPRSPAELDPTSAVFRTKRQAYKVSVGGGSVLITTDTASIGSELGMWGEWTQARECSRSCGGGILVEERQCNGECTGPATRYVSCNLDSCPTKSNFRAEQCAQNNEKPLDGKYFKWIPYPGKNKCELTCKPDTANFYYKWADKVVDGTHCGDDAVCVDGVCLPLGCDGRLGSVAKKDKCGVCNGNETTCKGVDGLFEEHGLQAGYHDVVTLPIGATDINISELHPTANSLVIKNSSGHFYLNGNYQIHLLDKDTITAGGTAFKYSKAQPNGEPEKLWAPGPLEEELTIALLFQPSATAKTSGVKYEFAIPLNENVSYYYKVGEWSSCSVTCGKGVQTRTPYCIDAKSNARVEDELCIENNATKPEFEKLCETVDCEAEWFTADWEECSESCGNNGWQYRIVYCHKVFADGRKITVADGNCSESRPIVKQQCNRFSCPEWHAGPWSACSQKCGDAKQYRSITCRSEKEGEEGRLLPADHCPASLDTALESERSCNLGPCEGLYFHTSEWNLCQRCNDTQETRNVTCRDQSGRVFPPEKCLNETISEIPVDTRSCATQAPCTYEWHTSQWSKCSTECGHGHKNRKVHCAINEMGDIEIVDEFLCVGDEKPADKEDCVNEAKCTGTYFTGPWSNCSAECGGGSHSRIVVCLNYDRKPVPEWCDEASKPANTENCNVDTCPTCENSTFGCCPDNSTFATGPSLEGCSNCSTSKFGCCADNYTTATGPNAQGCLEYEPPAEGSGEEDNTVFTTESALVDCEVANEETGEKITVPCSATIPPPAVDEAALLLSNNETEDSVNATKHCSKTEHGCCADWYTPAEGPEQAGCPEIKLGACNDTKHGCCPDNVTLARGPDFQGCGEATCAASLYGCCKDRRTIAFGPHYTGCERSSFPCELSNFGCCPDGETAALDKNLTGCGASCLLTKFGCCPDLKTHAKGPNNEGCGCEYAQYGCCPDGKSSAQGPGYYGCPATCAQSQYGCCPDGKTSARGPQKEGCPCQYTRWGCCPDGETTAPRPRNDGCDDCRHAKYGCCADGVSKAFGPNYAGCPTTTPAPFIIGGTIAPQKIASCNLPQDIGTACSAGSGWQTRWYYSTTDGRCAQFWFGGCGGGNENNYGSKEECEAVCERPPELGRCYLPKVEGPKECDQLAVRYWFDHTTRQCAAFWYRGCLGNANKFDTWEECQTFCSAADPLPVQPNRAAPAQLHPHNLQQVASQTPYGPPSVPQQQLQPHVPHPVIVPKIVQPTQPAQSGNGDSAKSREICGLRLDIGRCEGHFSSWYYEVATGLCEQFQYSGCGGNANRFHTKEQCENLCVRQAQSQSTTHSGSYRGNLAAFAPSTSAIEHQNIGVMGSVLQKVNRFIENAKSAAGIPSVCDSEKDAGTCSRFVAKWYYNKDDGTCNRFHYGGCDGNGNRFESEQDCKATCGEHVDACLLPKVAGPCAGKVERFHFDSATGKCMPFVYGGCLGNTNNFGSGAECTARCGTAPKIVDDKVPERCFQPKVIGPCRAMIDAFYYSTTLGECVQFDYGGCGGNLNRFYERKHCERMCRVSSMPSYNVIDRSAKDETLPLFKRHPREQPVLMYPIENSSYYYTQPLPVEIISTENRNVNTEENSIANAPSEPETEEETVVDDEDDENAITEFPTNPELLPDLCLQPEEPGDCYGEYLRWRYDSETRYCTSFLYSGCQQNANHFTSVEACERACGAYRNQSVCQMPHNAGRCLEGQDFNTLWFNDSNVAPITRWFYDAGLRTCHAFMWSGCGGNGNRFVGKAECEDLCSRESQPQQSMSSSDDICFFSRDSGPCADQLTQWYFDAGAATCRPFTYGGCRGNANRFNSKALCQQRCVNSSQSDSEITIQSNEPQIVKAEPSAVLSIPKRISARVQANQPSPYLSGKSVALRCIEDGGRYRRQRPLPPGTSYSWYWNETELRRNEFASEFDRQRIEFSENGRSIRIVNLKASDAGDYSCAIGADGIISAPYSVVVHAAPAFGDCTDQGSPATCAMVTRTGLCATARYGRFCCRTCLLKLKDDIK